MQKMIYIWRITNRGICRWFVQITAQPRLGSLPIELKYALLIGLLFLIVFESCNPNGNTIHLTDPVEAGREFIEASLKGNYDVAKKYVLADSLNMEYFNRLESFYKNRSTLERDGYKGANIIIDSIQNISDSVTIINYSNTFKKSPDKIKLVRINNEWRVDFKFTFSGNM